MNPSRDTNDNITARWSDKSTSARRSDAMNRQQLRALLDDVQSGALTPEAAHEPAPSISAPKRLRGPRVRARRPPAQRSARDFPKWCSARAKRRRRSPPLPSGSSPPATACWSHARPPRPSTAVRRTSARRIVPRTGANHYLAHRRRRRPAGARSCVAAAGTADLPVAEEAAISAEIMGNTVDRLYDVGVAGLHRLLAEHARLTAARVIIVVAGMEGALPSVVGGLVDVPVDRRPDQRRLRRQLRRHDRAAGDAEQLRQRRLGRQHRQRLRRRRHRQRDQSLACSGAAISASSAQNLPCRYHEFEDSPCPSYS